MLYLKNISKSINNKTILKNININFNNSELVCILGPSGSGKTTLLNLIAKNDLPTTGNILIYNKNINDIKETIYHNQYVSTIYQNYNLLQNLNVIDNILLPNRLTNKKTNNHKINNILTKLNINKIKKNSIKYLSGGEKQRVAIARSIITNTKILLADEPTGALDSKNSDKVMKLLKKVSINRLVIVVTHNESLALKYASRIIRISDGTIINDTKPNNKYKTKIFKEFKTKMKLKESLKLSIKNLLNNKIKNILTIIAFSIGLISLLLVLSLNNGFKKELNKLEHESLYNYPLIISKETINLDLSIDNQKYLKNQININKNKIIKNTIDNNLIKKINKIDNLIEGIAYYKDIDINFRNISHINPNNDYFKIIKGRFPNNNKEILLLLDYNNAIDENVKDYLNIDSVKYNDFLNKKIYVDNKELVITGIVKSSNNYFSSLNGILYSNDTFNKKITDIYIYPNNHNNKKLIKEQLKDYHVQDNAKSILDITNTLINSITIILSIFSIISLIVTIIMITITTYISVIERKKEIGLLKSLGARNKDIKTLFKLENNLLGLISSFLSITVCSIISKYFNNYLYNQINFKHLININIKLIIIIVFISIIITNISSIIPSYVASKKKIVDTLNN